MVKNLPAMWETWVQSLDWEGPLEEGVATYSVSLPGESPRTDEPEATVHGVTESDTIEQLSTAQQPSAVASTVSSSICHEVMGLDAMTLVFFNVEF